MRWSRNFPHTLKSSRLPQNEVLFHQGDQGDRMYVVASGALTVLLTNKDGLERRIDVLDTGESVGEIALLTGQKRSATVRALTDASLISLSKDGLDQLSQKYPELGKKLLEKMLPRIQRTQLALASHPPFRTAGRPGAARPATKSQLASLDGWRGAHPSR